MFKIMKNILSIIASIFLLGSITAKADVVVASAGPMSGQYASFGAQLKAGAEMWLKEQICITESCLRCRPLLLWIFYTGFKSLH